jgi:hypothetical protein
LFIHDDALEAECRLARPWFRVRGGRNAADDWQPRSEHCGPEDPGMKTVRHVEKLARPAHAVKPQEEKTVISAGL